GGGEGDRRRSPRGPTVAASFMGWAPGWIQLGLLGPGNCTIPACYRGLANGQPRARACFLVARAMLWRGGLLALAWARPDRRTRDVQRSMYVRVHRLWMALLGMTLNFACAVIDLFRKSWKTDSLAEASAEVGVVCGAVGIALGSIWGRPTWGVWWA